MEDVLLLFLLYTELVEGKKHCGFATHVVVKISRFFYGQLAICLWYIMNNCVKIM